MDPPDETRRCLRCKTAKHKTVCCGVARNGIVFGSPRRNDGILTFDKERLHVELRSLKVRGRFDFYILRDHWVLP